MPERPSLIQLAETRNWVPRVESKLAAEAIYLHFANHVGHAGDLAQFSAVIRQNFQDKIDLKLLRDSNSEWLSNNDYINHGLQASYTKLTLRGLVAVNMVEPDIEEGMVAGYMREPFVGLWVLDDFYQSYTDNRDERKRKVEGTHSL